MIKICKECGENFEPLSNQPQFCSESCRRKKRNRTGGINRLKHDYGSRPLHRFGAYKRGAELRQLEFSIDFERFMLFWKKDCTYCGSPIKTIGLDRIDSFKGYSLENITSCCKYCNFMKGKMTTQEFIIKCKAIAARFTAFVP